MAKSSLRIDILGTVITISADEDPSYLQRILEKYRKTIENVQRISGITDPLKTAVLAGFLLTEEMEKPENAEKTEARNEAERLTMGMISLLDEVMPETQPNLQIQSAANENFPKDIYRKDGPESETQPSFKALSPASLRLCGMKFESNVAGGVFKLQNTVKHYDWGSPEWLPALLGQENQDLAPWAELWMGVNPAGPSRVTYDETKTDTEAPLLSELISADSEIMLGNECAAQYGNLPFLFKVLAAAKPISIQAHPSTDQAVEGFDRENQEGIPLDAPERNYRDSRHKPELLCALSPFAALCGFRKKQEIYSLINKIAKLSDEEMKADLENLCSALEQEDENPLKIFISALFSMDTNKLGQFMVKRQALLERDLPEYQGEWRLCSYLANIYQKDPSEPGDPGILAPLFLNLTELKPGDAMYIPAGVPHAYIYGMGIEVMADSDNVLRGGLTAKHIDRKELLKILDYSEYRPKIIKAADTDSQAHVFSYPKQYEEFSLHVLKSQGEAFSYSAGGPSIILVTEGSVTIRKGGKQGLKMKTGESAFIPAGRNLLFSGNFCAYAASCKSL